MSTKENFIFKGTPRFTLLRELGAGGMGVVYEVFDEERKITVALKTLKKMSPQGLYLFKNEFRALANLRHPNLIRLYELINEGDVWFFTMELLEGTDFFTFVCATEQTLQDDGATQESLENVAYAATHAPSYDSLDAETALKTVNPDSVRTPHKLFDEKKLRLALAQLSLGVEALHTAGKVHRDIKPSNTLVTKDGRVVLMDMGLVARSGEQDKENLLVGTPVYMSPEQALGDVVGPAADWYSVGVMLYEAMTDVLPFDGAHTHILFQKTTRDPLPPGSLIRSLPQDLEALCVSLLSRKPEERPNGREVLARLGVSRPRNMTMVALSSESNMQGSFVGRASEQQRLVQAFVETQSGKPLFVIVEGESGIGKSALVQHLLQPIIKDQSAVVLAGRCYEQEQVPYKAFDGVIDSLSKYLLSLPPMNAELLLPDGRGLLGQLFPVLSRIKSIKQSPEEHIGDPLQLRHRAFIVLRELLCRLGRQDPLIIFIDDLQWADADSFALLEEVLRPPMAPALLLLATRRTGASLKLPEEIPSQTISLDSLSDEDSMALVRRSLVAPEMHLRLLQESQGHPLFLQELLRYNTAAQASPKSSLEEIIFSRVERLDEKSRLLLELVVIAGAPMENQQLRKVSDIEPAQYREHIDTLRTAHLLKTLGAQDHDLVELYHNRVGETVRAKLPAEEHKRHHLRFAEVLEWEGEEDAHALVRHLESAGEERRAVIYAEQAALSSRNALAFEKAAEYYSRALRFASSNDPRRPTWSSAKAQCYANAGQGPEAAEAYLEVAKEAEPRDRLTYLNQAAEHLLGSGYLARGKEIVVQVLADVGEKLPPTPRRALLSLLWSRFKIRLHGLRWKEKSEAEIDPKQLLRLDIYKAVSIGIGQIDTMQGSNFQAKNLYLALITGERKRLSRAVALECVFQSIQGVKNKARADVLIQRAKELEQQEPGPYLRGIVSGSQGISQYLMGQFSAAEKSLLESEQCLQDRTLGATWELNNARVYRMFNNLRFMGRFGDERAKFNEYLTDAQRRGDRFMETILSCAFNIMWLADDAPEQAKEVLTQTLRALPELGDRTVQKFDLQPQFWDLWARSHIALYQQKVEDFAPLLEAFDRSRGSLLLRSQIARAYHHWIQGALAVTQLQRGIEPKASLKRAKQMISLLSKEKVPYISVFHQALQTALLFIQGDEAGALKGLRAVATNAKNTELFAVSALAKYQLHLMLQDEEGPTLKQEAEFFFFQQRIKNPKSFALVYLPGFTGPRRQ